MSMSIRATKFPDARWDIDPKWGIDAPNRDIFGRKTIKVDRCPICGAACLPGNNALRRFEGFDVRDGYAYTLKSLRVTFCRECLIGEGGVDIICRVIEANESQRKAVEKDAHAILKQLHDELMVKIRNWAIGIGAALAIIGICCLIWKPEEVFGCIGIIAILLVVGFLQSLGRR